MIYTTPYPNFPQNFLPIFLQSEFRLISSLMIMRSQFDLRGWWVPPPDPDRGSRQPQSLISPQLGPLAHPRPPCEQLLSVAFSPVQADARPPRSTCRDRWTLSLTTGCPSPLPRSGTPPTEVRTTRRQCPPGFLFPPFPFLFIPLHLPPPLTLIWFLVFFFYYYNCRLWWPACLPVLGDWSFTTFSLLLSHSRSRMHRGFFDFSWWLSLILSLLCIFDQPPFHINITEPYFVTYFGVLHRFISSHHNTFLLVVPPRLYCWWLGVVVVVVLVVDFIVWLLQMKVQQLNAHTLCNIVVYVLYITCFHRDETCSWIYLNLQHVLLPPWKKHNGSV